MTIDILFFHPDSAASRANRALADAAAQLPGVAVTDMGALYPDPRAIDVEREIARLLGTSGLVLQFPVQWYSTPPLLKAWQDSVLTHAYYVRPQEEGERLRDLPVTIAATAGNVVEAYRPDGVNLFPLPDLLHPLRATAHRCFWSWRDPFLLYRANRLSDEELEKAGQDYVDHLRSAFAMPS